MRQRYQAPLSRTDFENTADKFIDRVASRILSNSSAAVCPKRVVRINRRGFNTEAK
jgi:hypothetical protein